MRRSPEFLLTSTSVQRQEPIREGVMKELEGFNRIASIKKNKN